MNSLGCKNAWLVIFDRNEKKSWDEKIYQKEKIIDGKTINIFGC
jgi:hypothetical protein